MAKGEEGSIGDPGEPDLEGSGFWLVKISPGVCSASPPSCRGIAVAKAEAKKLRFLASLEMTRKGLVEMTEDLVERTGEDLSERKM
jgi:hypothetical protein